MKKVLMVATVPSMIGQFNMNNVQILQDMGYEVHVGCDFTDRSVWPEEKVTSFISELKQLNIKYFQINFCRSAIKINRHIISYKQLKKIVKKNQYEFIHCHTPIAGVIGRLVCKNTKTKCIYTAHGFHFYKGAPIRNWLIFYPIEWLCSWWTDVLITINKEDYRRAKRRFYAKKCEYVPGAGIKTGHFIAKLTEIEIDRLKTQYSIDHENTILLSVGELNNNKNHESVIRIISKLKKELGNITYLICGKGELAEYLEKLIHEERVQESVKLLGFCNNIDEIMQIADYYIHPSFREGLPVAVMEAMASGLPVICRQIRGNNDLIENGQGGYLYHDDEELSKIIRGLNKNDVSEMGAFNKKKIEDFSAEKVNQAMVQIYKKCKI